MVKSNKAKVQQAKNEAAYQREMDKYYAKIRSSYKKNQINNECKVNESWINEDCENEINDNKSVYSDVSENYINDHDIDIDEEQLTDEEKELIDDCETNEHYIIDHNDDEETDEDILYRLFQIENAVDYEKDNREDSDYPDSDYNTDSDDDDDFKEENKNGISKDQMNNQNLKQDIDVKMNLMFDLFLRIERGLGIHDKFNDIKDKRRDMKRASIPHYNTILNNITKSIRELTNILNSHDFTTCLNNDEIQTITESNNLLKQYELTESEKQQNKFEDYMSTVIKQLDDHTDEMDEYKRDFSEWENDYHVYDEFNDSHVYDGIEEEKDEEKSKDPKN
jgi:hypothetical protein